MPQFLFTDDSKQDLIQIRRFTVERWGHEQSGHYLGNLKKTLQLLSEMPSMGKTCCEELGKNLNLFLFGSHVIYYHLISDERIVVVAILHQSMVPAKHLEARIDS
jgi:toxin ParE1/3/4